MKNKTSFNHKLGISFYAMLGVSNFLKTFAMAFILIFFSACSEDKKEDAKQEEIKHELRKFNVKTSIHESASASYFLVMGSYSSSKSEQTNVRFYFKNCLGEYQFMELELKKIRIKIDSTQAPYVVIKPGYNNYKCYEMQDARMVGSVTIHCKETDFQPEININDLR